MSTEKTFSNRTEYREELDKIVRGVSSSVDEIVSLIYGGLGKYIIDKENEIKGIIDSFNNDSKKVIKNYLEFFIKSNKIYEFAFGMAIKDVGYAPRTLEDLLRRPIDQETNREDRIASRYASAILYKLLPPAVQELYYKKSINSVSETISESLEKELIYLSQYLTNSGVKDKEMEASIRLLSDLIKLPYDVIKQQYLALSTVFRPDVIDRITNGTNEYLMELFKKFYNNFISNFEVKIEETSEKKEEGIVENKTDKLEIKNSEKSKKRKRNIKD